MTQPTPVIDVDVSSLSSTPNPVTDGLGGRLTRMGVVYRAVRLLVAWANAAKSAADLTTGYLASARIQDASLPLGKLQTAVATAEDLAAVRGIAEGAASVAAGQVPTRSMTGSGALTLADRGGIVHMRNTAPATVLVPLSNTAAFPAAGATLIEVDRFGADVEIAPYVQGSTLQRLVAPRGLKLDNFTGAQAFLQLIRTGTVPARPTTGLRALIVGDQFSTGSTALADGATIDTVTADPSGSLTLPVITPTGAQRPTVKRNAANGHTGITFNGVSNRLPLAGGWLDLFRNRPNAMIFVTYLVTNPSLSGDRALLGFATGNGAPRVLLKQRDNGSGLTVIGGRQLDTDTVSRYVNVGQANAPELSVLCARYRWSAGQLVGLENNVVVNTDSAYFTAANTSDTASASASIGSAYDGSGQFLAGTILEVAVYDDNDTVRAAYQAFADAQYGSEWLVTGDLVV